MNAIKVKTISAGLASATYKGIEYTITKNENCAGDPGYRWHGETAEEGLPEVWGRTRAAVAQTIVFHVNRMS